MSENLAPFHFPLFGSRLIEASAGTGKTWTISALYLRLILGHGGENGFQRPLAPAEILVMTFTRAATGELSDRIRSRLLEAAAGFRGEPLPAHDAFLHQLIQAYPDASDQAAAAYRLTLAAEGMDNAAIFTIDAWCQRMLKEHAFDSGNLFEETLLSDETPLRNDAIHDYWRQYVYPLPQTALSHVQTEWQDVTQLQRVGQALLGKLPSLAPPSDRHLHTLLASWEAEHTHALARIKQGWESRAEAMRVWFAAQTAQDQQAFSRSKIKTPNPYAWFDALATWARTSALIKPDLKDTAWKRLTPEGMADARNAKCTIEIPALFDAISTLQAELDALPSLKPLLHTHAAFHIDARLTALKQKAAQFSFADTQLRLHAALAGDNQAALRARILQQYPVCLIDEFQDTSPLQYQIFDALYQVKSNTPDQGIFLIGDPKQSIYGFRGADIYSYLAARRATTGRHYALAKNFRATQALVEAVNHVFLRAEGGEHAATHQTGSQLDPQADSQPGYPAGAFHFRTATENPVPFEPVSAQGRDTTFTHHNTAVPALTLGYAQINPLNQPEYQRHMAEHCAEHIAGLLGDEHVGFTSPHGWRRLAPADIAILVPGKKEAACMKRALQQRGIASVYLSDKNSVLDTLEAADVLRWLRAAANPLEGDLVRAALATTTARQSLAHLAALSTDEFALDDHIEQFKTLQTLWQRQGVLAMLRHWIHVLDLPAQLLNEMGGERCLSNLLHVGELLQGASQHLKGEHALIRWLSEQIQQAAQTQKTADDGDGRMLRLESDADLLKISTIHKSKGLEYPLVYAPFVAQCKKFNGLKKNGTAPFIEYTDADQIKHLDWQNSDAARTAAEAARLEEDLRLLYVTLTRAQYAVWLGVGLADTKNGKFQESAFGYLVSGGEDITESNFLPKLVALKGQNPHIVLTPCHEKAGLTRLNRPQARPPLRDLADFASALAACKIETHWRVGSFSSLTREVHSAPAPALPAEVHLLEGDLLEQDRLEQDRLEHDRLAGESAELAAPDPAQAILSVNQSAWHRFPKGALPGTFLHDQLEWIAHRGFAAVLEAPFAAQLQLRCEQAGWGHHAADTQTWLQAVVSTPLPPLNIALAQLPTSTPEMEFWLPSHAASAMQIDQLCQHYLLDQRARPALASSTLHGMLKGYIDQVFEYQGRYWVLDYKSNSLGQTDAAYGAEALAESVASHRYDVQGALYMLALHRLLRSRLGAAYHPAQHLGGAIFFFLRGIANAETHGCAHLPPHPALLDALDACFTAPEAV